METSADNAARHIDPCFAEPAKPQPRRWAQFRLRSLLFLILLCCVVLAVAVPYIESYRLEWRAYRELSRLPQPAQIGMGPAAPAWLRPFGADRYLQRILGVDVVDCDDDSLAILAELPALESLQVHSTKVTDKGLKHIEGCKKLFHLELDCPKVSDRGLESLAKLSELGSVTLKTPRITDAGLKNLACLNELRTLVIVAPKVRDDGLKHLAGLALWRLTITASLTDRGLGHLVERRDLRWSPNQLAQRQSIVFVRPGKEPVVDALREVTDADFQDQPLCDVLEYIGQRHGITLSTLEDLKKSGVDPMTPITIKTPKAYPRGPGGYGYLLYDLLNDVLSPVGLDWRIGTTTDIEVLPLDTLSRERPNLLKLRAAWPQSPVIVDW